MNQPNLMDVLNAIDPCSLSYDEWFNVGMAIKHEGGTAADWESWSQRDHARYKSGECFRKWESFRGSATPITIGTLVTLAKAQGWRPQHVQRPVVCYDYNDMIPAADNDYKIPQRDVLDKPDLLEPSDWNPVEQIIQYLEALFQPDEIIAYNLKSHLKDPNDASKGFGPCDNGQFRRTAGEIIRELRSVSFEGALNGEYNPEAGAWIRINPLDGEGTKDSNVSAYRHCLVEADDTEKWPIEKQLELYYNLQLPCAAIVHSGNKSVHAIVKIDAQTYEEYIKRTDYLFDTVLAKNDFEPDAKKNRNLNRLSRLPGCVRGDKKQYIIELNSGKTNWNDWVDWIEAENDNLPDFECLADIAENPPELADELIRGVLRKGHKMLLAGPSKAGKSFLLMELAIAVAEGRRWLEWDVAQGKVLYVNLELDPASAGQRLITLYDQMAYTKANMSNLDIWNLRGMAAPLNVLAPKLIRRAMKRNYDMVIIDPIYKVLTGSENEADDMAAFCNEFDKICHALGAATVYCHHHSKGSQGQKSSRDRSSGSGVFARDPDAIIDIIELDIPDDLRKTVINRDMCNAGTAWLDANFDNWQVVINQDDALVSKKLTEQAQGMLPNNQFTEFRNAITKAREAAESASGWRIESTLREFRTFNPVNIWFRYPLHTPDKDGLLTDAKADGEQAPWESRRQNKREKPKQTNEDKARIAFNSLVQLSDDRVTTVNELQKTAGLSDTAMEKILRRHPGMAEIADGKVMAKDDIARMAIAAQGKGQSYADFIEDIGLKFNKKVLSKWVQKVNHEMDSSTENH